MFFEGFCYGVAKIGVVYTFGGIGSEVDYFYIVVLQVVYDCVFIGYSCVVVSDGYNPF